MSEFQVISFRALDRPVSDANLKFMAMQSTRADITPWSFDNEYWYGDFSGDTIGMLRRGYDFHVHYANFGIRKIMMTLPAGFPHAQRAKPFLIPNEIHFIRNERGKGGILCLEPRADLVRANELPSPWQMIDRLLPLRQEISAGDLRPLFLAHLATVFEPDEALAKKLPVPPGLKRLTRAQKALVEFFGVTDELLAWAAARSASLPAPKRSEQNN
ncbi:MAG: hypothetical protein KatS3mg105_4306 [Gemmatales bacterium]|nr:MAG: hypothetical protein KatS3mg105_4306 [Gemmatales bacterium]